MEKQNRFEATGQAWLQLQLSRAPGLGWAGTHHFTSRRFLHTLEHPGPLVKQCRDKQGHTHHSQHGTWTEWPTEGSSRSFRITSQPQNPRWPEHLRQHRARMRARETVRARQPASRSPAWWDLCKKPATRPPAWTGLQPRLPPGCDQQGPGSSRAGLAMAERHQSPGVQTT